MLLKSICPVALALFMLFSCSDEATHEAPETPVEESNLDTDSTFVDCDSFIKEHIGIGTACCISGYIVAIPGDTTTFHYQINHPDAKVSWVILSGDISILAGKDSTTVTVLIGPDFTGGILQAYGSGLYDQTRLICNDHIDIKPLQ